MPFLIEVRRVPALRLRRSVMGVLTMLLGCATPDAKAGLGPPDSSPITQLTIAPAAVAVDVGEFYTFSVSATHEDGTNSVPPVTWSATGGTISAAGVYTPGATPGTYSVTATLVGDSLAATAAVTVNAVVSPIVNISTSPASTSMFTGESQQFVVTATRQNGAAVVPSVTWTATGGGISAGGLYTAGGAVGTYMVIATLQGGILSDTSIVTLIAPSGGPYPHRPAAFTNEREIDFSQAVPAFTTSGDRPIAGVSFAVLYDHTNSPDGQSNFTLMTDPTAPQSPSGVWRLHFMPGTWTTGHGVGNIFTTGSLPGAPSALYVSLWHKVDANYPWHAISNKFLYMVPGQVLVQIREGSKWLHGESLDAGQWLDNANGPLNGAQLLVYKNDPVTAGVWHHYEVLVDKVAGTFKIWMDGDLKTSAINVRFPETYFDQVMLTGHRGGGGETLTRDGYWYYDHLMISWP